jgi:hypothetical protein
VRALLYGTVAIAVFGAAAFAGVYWATAGDRGARPAGMDPLPALPPEPAPPPLPDFSRLPPPAAILSPPQPVPIPRYQPPKDSWEAIAPAARASTLGPVGVDVGRDLIALQDQLSTCFNPEVASQAGRAAPSRTADPESHQDLAETILVLELEAGNGTVRIVDAPIESHGSAEDMTIACAQRVLRGRTIHSATARAGGRYRLLHQLHP